MSLTIITAYYAKQDEARKALLELTRKGFGAAVLIQKGADGVTQTVDPFLRRRTIRASFAAILFGGFGTIISLFLQWQQFLPAGDIFAFPVVFLMCAAIGGLGFLALFPTR